MISKRLLHLAQLSAVGLGGYYIGQYEKFNTKESILVDGKLLSSKPGLPIFGTVSAATPFTDSSTPKDRVRLIQRNLSIIQQ